MKHLRIYKKCVDSKDMEFVMKEKYAQICGRNDTGRVNDGQKNIGEDSDGESVKK